MTQHRVGNHQHPGHGAIAQQTASLTVGTELQPALIVAPGEQSGYSGRCWHELSSYVGYGEATAEQWHFRSGPIDTFGGWAGRHDERGCKSIRTAVDSCYIDVAIR